MASELNSFSSDSGTWQDFGAPAEITDAMRVDVLADIAHDLISTLTTTGRMSESEARGWLAEVNAVALNRPELLSA